MIYFGTTATTSPTNYLCFSAAPVSHSTSSTYPLKSLARNYTPLIKTTKHDFIDSSHFLVPK